MFLQDPYGILRYLTLLNNHRRVSDEKQKQEYLVRANAIKEQAKKQHIALDSKSLKALEKANLTKSNTNTKER